MNKLKLCPCCGGKAELVKQTDGYKINPVHIIHNFYVECSQCGISTKTFQKKTLGIELKEVFGDEE